MRLFAWRPGRLAWNTVNAGGWSALRIAIQAASLVLLARLFGAQGYGALAGTLAIYITLAQLVGLGTGISFFRHVVRTNGVARIGPTQVVYLLTGIGFFLVAWPASLWLFPQGGLTPPALAAFAFAELVIAPSFLPLAYRYQACERMSVSGGLLTAAPIARFVAILIALFFGARSLQSFSFIYAACLLAGALGVTAILWPRKGVTWNGASIPAEIREGFPYAITGATVTAGGELDKAFMLRLAGEAFAGHYAAAARVAQAAILPVNALMVAAAPRWFRADRSQPVLARSGALFAVAGCYALVAGAAIFVCAPWLPVLLGPQFQPSVLLLQLFCLAIVTGSARQLIGMLLTASDLQASRNLIEILALLAGLAPMPFLIRLMGGPGAVLCFLFGDVVLVALGLRALWKYDRVVPEEARDG
ncbi:MAG TPA: hypothetical protein VFG18_06360 [Xanthomonadaceae bacterium]|nr:hypothetical protein [Xanthomonadaceae bacterium]